MGAYGDSSGATGIDADQADASAPNAGAAYVFTRNAGKSSQQAYVKASNTRPQARFGGALALSGDTLAVGASLESGRATGVNGNEDDTTTGPAGAVYLFTRSGTTWSKQAFVKASNTHTGASAAAGFGGAVALSSDTLAVAAANEWSSSTGINGNPSDTFAQNAGAVYLLR